jgi:long-chain acyl-CoA synthetase
LKLKDNKVIVIGETSAQWIATYMATITAGGVIVPLDPALLEEEIIKFVKHAGAQAIVYSKDFDELFKRHEDELDEVRHFIAIDKSLFTLKEEKPFEFTKFCEFNNILALGDFLYAHSELTIDEDRDTEKMSALLFTSGTTGTSKGVMLSEKNICTVVNGGYKIFPQITKDDVLLSVLPLYHTYEMSCGILAPMMFGCTICLSDGIKYVSKNIKQFSPTIMTLVPLFINSIYKNIMKSAQKEGLDKFLTAGVKLSKLLRFAKIDLRKKIFASIQSALGGRLKYFIVGGAAVDPKMIKAFDDFGIHISQGYGITECAPLISAVRFDEYNPTSCGKPAHYMQVFIDKNSPDDTFGEIVVKGDNVMLGYYENEEETAKVLHDGWFRTGDYGYLDEKGYLYITGRKKNVIVLEGGKNVFPEEIEEYLGAVSLIEECVVIGREEDGKTNIVALVYPSSDECRRLGLEDKDEISKKIAAEITKINKKLASYKHVAKIELVDEPFEKTTSQKIKRHIIKK